MNPSQILVFLLIGAVAGWLAGVLVKGGGFGLLGNIVVGILGAVVGGWLADVLGIHIGGEWLGPILTATGGAVALLFVLRMLKK